MKFVASCVKFVTRFFDKMYFIDTFIAFYKMRFNHKIGNFVRAMVLLFFTLLQYQRNFETFLITYITRS